MKAKPAWIAALALAAIFATVPAPETFGESLGPGARLRERLRQRMAGSNQAEQRECSKCSIAGLDVAVWKPDSEGRAPLVIFSHGFGGKNTQSTFITKAMAQAGYLVIAPNHKDANGAKDTHYKPEVSFAKYQDWSDQTYIDRRKDVVDLLQALRQDPAWEKQIDWSRLALCGHSLGGYTVLGLVGGWPSWKIEGVKGVIALSPYVTPYTANGTLASLNVPVMYQGGTRDWGCTPAVKKSGGAFSQTGSPAYYVEFDQFNHFTWSDFNRDREKQDEINYYCLAFLDKYVKGIDDARLNKRITGVSDLEAK